MATTRTLTFNIGWQPIRLWKDDNGWHYDGPAFCGPRHVRTSGRGPSWTGPITNYFARELQRRLRKAGYQATAILFCVFLLSGCAAPCKAPTDLVTVAQYPDGTFSVDVYDADGDLASTVHLPEDALISDIFPRKDQ